MKSLPQISEAEFQVMKIVWKYAPINTNEITDHLTKTTDWNPKTIHTLIKRLVTKGVLTYEKQPPHTWRLITSLGTRHTCNAQITCRQNTLTYSNFALE